MTQRIDAHRLAKQLEEPDVRVIDVRFSLEQPADRKSVV